MSHMAEVAKIFGVELREEFIIPEYSDAQKFRFTEDGLWAWNIPECAWKCNHNCRIILSLLLSGSFTIQKRNEVKE